MSEAVNEQRHPTLYKATGDLVISATTGDTTHLFRVHTVILAEHSPVFSGMFTLPRNPGVEMQTYDGVPIVHLTDDAKDVTSLLQLLYSPGSPIFKMERTFAADVYGLMSMATKYQLDSVCTIISESLKEQWPSTLTAFLQMRADARYKAVGPFSGKARCLPEPASAIRLATDFNISGVLPAAYYVLATYDITGPPRSLAARLSPRWDLLRPEELLRYYQGKLQHSRQLVETAEIYAEMMYDEDHDGCDTLLENFDWDAGNYSDRSKCLQIINKAREDTRAEYPNLSCSYDAIIGADPIDSVVQIYEDPSIAKLCSSCHASFNSRCRERIQYIWKALAQTFSLNGPIRVPVSSDER